MCKAFDFLHSNFCSRFTRSNNNRISNSFSRIISKTVTSTTKRRKKKKKYFFICSSITTALCRKRQHKVFTRPSLFLFEMMKQERSTKLYIFCVWLSHRACACARLFTVYADDNKNKKTSNERFFFRCRTIMNTLIGK